MGSEATGPDKAGKGRSSGALSEESQQIMALLQELLQAGPMRETQVWQRVKERFGERALHNYKRARARLRIQAIRHGFGRGSWSELQLPPPSKNH